MNALELSQAIRSQEISAREALQHHLEVVERSNAEVNAIVTLAEHMSYERAIAADQAISQGEVWGPLHGVPMTIKDSFETAGIRTTSGSSTLMTHIPSDNAVAVQRLVSAGANIIGKSNLPEWAADLQTYNRPFGVTVNPHDPDRTPGGSSGGAAAALALGMTPLELGSDIGGSIRTPASWSGVFGHKPSHGLVPSRGHIPGPPGTTAESDLAVIGPMSRSASDLALMFDVIAGPSGSAAKAWRLHLPPPRIAALDELRVGLWIDDDEAPLADDVRKGIESLASAMESAGASVRAVRPVQSLDALTSLFCDLLYPITTAGIPRHIFEEWARKAIEGFDETDPTTPIQRSGAIHHRTWLARNERRHRMLRTAEQTFEEVDILVCPVVPVPAIPHDHSQPIAGRTIRIDGSTRNYHDLFRWISYATILHLPATVMPIGVSSSGLPIGVQLIGPHLEDRTTLKVAHLLEEELGYSAIVPKTSESLT